MLSSRHSDSPPARGSVAYGCGSVPDFDRLPLLEGGCVTGRPASSDRTRPTVEPSHPAQQGEVGTVGPVSAVDAAPAEPTPRDPEYRCSPWTQAQGVDPIGSAGAFDELLLVEWALPWPSDVSEIEPLAAAAADPEPRVMTVVPHADAAEDGLRRVVHHRRTGTHALRRGRPPGRGGRASPICWPRCSTQPDRPLARLADRRRRRAARRCWCAATAAAIRAAGGGARCCTPSWPPAGPPARVWRCSHTGGHRFAPTAITLPDGRAWAYADVALLDGVLARTGDVAALAAHDRGCTAFDPWAQVVERALFVEHGWAWLDGDVTACAHRGRRRRAVRRRRARVAAGRRHHRPQPTARSSSRGSCRCSCAASRRRRPRRPAPSWRCAASTTAEVRGA